MQCAIGNAASGYALGEVEVVKLSQADGGSWSMCHFWWKAFLSWPPQQV